jgi:ABC-type amino acid transport substrate-binding protein
MRKRSLVTLFALLIVFALVAPVAATTQSNPVRDSTSQVSGEVIRIGTNAEYPPFEEIDEDANFVGFDIDLMNALAEDAGFELEWVNTRWDGIFFALAEGEFDAVISAATILTSRERIVDFTIPYFVASQSIAVSVDVAEDVATPDDLAGLRVGVQTGTTGDFYATDEVEGAEVVRFDETTLAFQALGQGDVDAVIADTPASAAIIANNPDLNATLVGDPLTEEFYGIAVRPDFPELLDALNVSLQNLFDDGTYTEIHEQWFDAPPLDFLLQGDYELDVFEVDSSDPASIAYYALYSVLVEGNLDEHAAVSCDAYVESDDFITEEFLEAFANVTFDLSGLEADVEIDGDTAVATFSGTITVDDGTQQIEAEIGDILPEENTTAELTQTEDGDWLYCPALSAGE